MEGGTGDTFFDKYHLGEVVGKWVLIELIGYLFSLQRVWHLSAFQTVEGKVE